ncbi:alcohol dehydrogenase catalytic domain-containing protein, partial [Streptomyces sp. NPDC056500]|uniref:SpnB-like Rossmann fold domain-containing protein n=1 Tax=Streptomyces sp. NPDC056500 TaxID=3345840 RepID=UPI0036B16308
PNQPIHLPFTWNNVTLHATGATTLRVRLTPTAPNTITLFAADGAGLPVASVSELVIRPMGADQLTPHGDIRDESLHRLAWTALETAPATGDRLAVVGMDRFGLAEAGVSVDPYQDLAALAEALNSGAPAPAAVLVGCSAQNDVSARGLPATEDTLSGTRLAAEAHQVARDALEILQSWLADPQFDAMRLVLLTQRAVATGSGEGPKDPASAAVWGLVRSAQSEHPDRFTLIDLDGAEASSLALPLAVASGEPQLALRAGVARTPHLASAKSSGALEIPRGVPAWSLDLHRGNTLEELTLVPCPEVLEPLSQGQIRVSVRATGLNFRDVLLALDVVPSTDVPFGGEGAGVVTEVGPGVSGLTEGDRVMGFMEGSYGGPVAVVDHRLVARVPEGWSFARAASVPVVFLTAYYALVDIARAQPGERVLIHAAAGGVGMAAVQLAHHLDLEIYAT